MANEPNKDLEQQGGLQERALKEKESASKALEKFGGFTLLETTVNGLENMSPERKARREIFLKEESKKDERIALSKRLQMWLEVLNASEDVSKMIESADEKAKIQEKLYAKNMKSALDGSHEMEVAYRSVALFYKNTDQDKLKNVSILNADKEQLTDLDNTTFIDAVNQELAQNYDRLDLRDNYSLLVIPGYLGAKKVVDKWARIANKHKVMLLTDFRHLDSVDDTVALFEAENLTGGDGYLSNVIMSCNYIVSRQKEASVNEANDIHVPPSSALAGKLYTTLMSQVSAGRTFGALNEVDSVTFPLRKSEINQLDKIGLVPMVDEYGKVMAFSGKTLFNGDNIGMKTYSVVRCFDYISKVLVDFLNRRAFENWNATTKKDLRSQIANFLDSIKGPKGLIEKWEIFKLDQDPNQKDKINLDIYIKPYFPAKTFLMQLEGTKGEEPGDIEWESDYNPKAE
jgi:hypothetical protein